jgi:hypothetical protein
MSRLIAALLVLLLARPHALAGQTAATATALLPGARVRIARAGEKPRVAIVVAHTADTLQVRWPEFANTVALPLAGISRLDVSTGRHRNVVKGMVLGTVGVGALGAAAGAISYQPCTPTKFMTCFLAPTSRAQSAMVGGALGGTLGFVVGSLVGLVRHESWKRVSLDDRRVAAAVGPGAHGTGLGVSLRF